MRRRTTLAVAALALAGAAGASSANAAASPERLATCTPAHQHKVTDDDIQADGLDLEDKIRATPIRHSYLGMSFGSGHVRVHVYMRNHDHDAAILRCARQMHIAKYVKISLHRFSYGQLLGAIRRIEDALPDLYSAGLFECSYGAADHFDIDVYRAATDAQYRQIKHQANKTHVAFEIHRLTTDPPQSEDL